MGRALWLADALRAEGVDVTEVGGWQTRGRDDLTPQVIVCHHTASSSNGGDAPSLPVVTYGRPDVPPPLCNVLLARSGRVYVVASGTANNAGRGSWSGIVGNHNTLGIEAENNGIGEPWPVVQLDAYARICAAFCRQLGVSVLHVIGHKEWTTRKIDPSFDMGEFRVAVAAQLANQQELTVAQIDDIIRRLDRIDGKLDAMEKDRLKPTTSRVRVILEHLGLKDPA